MVQNKRKERDQRCQEECSIYQGSREIMTAVRLGGSADPEQNSALAAILRRLKDIPKENIQNALEKVH
ncbi:hypothetical protein B0H14DRAFT_2230 [Mycena olivaceomarginata]|nr:hypothetical protein B0H14DRAFT_2230 [Mycena olivaceomarginata]